MSNVFLAAVIAGILFTLGFDLLVKFLQTLQPYAAAVIVLVPMYLVVGYFSYQYFTLKEERA